MQNIRKVKRCIITSISCFFIMSIDFMLMSISNYTTSVNLKVVDVLIGILFWTSFAIGIVFYTIFAKECKKQYFQSSKAKGVFKERKVGLFTFFSNSYASVADLVLIISTVVFIILMIVTDRTSFICFFIVSLLVFSFCMHCILNGKVYNSLFSKNNK